MKVIFLKDTPGQGSVGWRKGQVAEVSEGYGRNFLIAKGFAAVVTPQMQVKLSKEAKDAEEKKHRQEQKNLELKKELEKKVFNLQVKVGEKGQIFGAVREKEIAEAISGKTGFVVDRAQINISKPIKSLGDHMAGVVLGKTVAKVKLTVNPL